MATTTEIISTIGAVQTLIENFPMGIFDLFGNKVYTNAIEFILDVLKQLGMSPMDLVNKLIEFFFDVPNAIELYGMNGNYRYQLIKKPTKEQKAQADIFPEMPSVINENSSNYIFVEDEEAYYVKKAPTPTEIQSDFFNGLEYSVKGIIQNILTGLLSCSIVPDISNKYIDTEGGICIKIQKEALDLSNLLDIYPFSDIGSNFYSGVDDGDMDVNTLYRTNDLNAFIWYVINRGSNISQYEENKMMWDSRIDANRNGSDSDKREGDEAWSAWTGSKTAYTEYFYTSGNSTEYNNAFLNHRTDDLPLHPILQFEPCDDFGYNNGIQVVFPNQTWGTDKLFNKSIYEFNADYLKNIQIFNPRLIISSMIDTLLNGSLLSAINLTASVQNKLFESKLKEVIKNAIESEDMTVSDCFFSFSNDDFDKALQEMELEKYSAKKLNSETSPAIKIDENIGIDSMNEINSMATMNEKISAITKTVYDIATIPMTDKSISISDKLSIGYNEKWITDVIMALVTPLAKAILSPKVMLLFIINFQIMGLINIEAIENLEDVMNLFLKKIISIIVSLVQYIRDRIVEFLFDLFMKTIKPLLVQFGILILNEKLEAWLELLAEAFACIPLFDFSRFNMTEIDDVRYADITQTQEIPETEKTC